mgnify:CR=1 FL=1
MICLVKVLIVYYSESQKGKQGNEVKVASRLEKRFIEKNFEVTVFKLEIEKRLGLNQQFKREKSISLKQNIPNVSDYKLVIIGSPIVGSLTSAPAVNAFIRGLDQEKVSDSRFAIYATGIIPGFALKKMSSLLSMKGIKPIESAVFTSIFEFDDKKMREVDQFFDKVIEKIHQ